MEQTVLDLIIATSKGRELPENIRIKEIRNKIWIRFEDQYYNGKDSLGNIAAFNPTWLNAEIEIVFRQEGAK